MPRGNCKSNADCTQSLTLFVHKSKEDLKKKKTPLTNVTLLNSSAYYRESVHKLREDNLLQFLVENFLKFTQDIEKVNFFLIHKELLQTNKVNKVIFIYQKGIHSLKDDTMHAIDISYILLIYELWM